MGIEIDAKRGVANHYGVRSTTGQYGSQQSTKQGIVKSAFWDFAYNTLPNGGANNLQFVIPANAIIVSAKLIIDTAFTSTSTTTDLDIGLVSSAGAEVDLNGLVTATEATQTAIAVDNSVITGAGALIGKTIGAVAGELKVTPTVDDLLTGAGRVVVEYIYNN